AFTLAISITLFFIPLIWALILHPIWFKILVFGQKAPKKSLQRLKSQISIWSMGLLPATTVLFGGVLLQVSFAERSESIYFYSGDAWGPILFLAGLIFLWTLIQLYLSNEGMESSPEWIRNLPSRPIWGFLIIWILMLCFLLRAYDLDYQTVDDDEYASIQAAMAIAETGKPQYSENVWY